MPPLSNPRPPADAMQYHTAATEELDPALRLLLGSSTGRAGDEQLIEFVAASRQRGLDVGETWVATLNGQVVWSLLPVISPGRTMLVLTPPHAPTRASGQARAVTELTERLCHDHRQRHGLDLAQMLVDPAEISLTQLYLSCGFLDLAELIYMQRAIRRMPAVPPLPPDVRIETYQESNHADFARAIRQSYIDSLDCPALNGLRDMEDVLIGHKHSGEFDPTLWFLLRGEGDAIGVMLLGRASRPEAVELVYLGLSPSARGRGWGDLMVQLALVTVVRENRSHLTLAVDSRNAPAMKLYQRHGLGRIGSRRALIRDLRLI